MSPELITIITTLALYAVAVISPGPGFALVGRLAVSGARPAAIGATFGLALAAGFYAILTMTGLALTRIGWLASLVQIAGGCYLIYLGVMAWLSSGSETKTHYQQVVSRSALRGFRTGVLVNLSNPKGIAFFLSLYAVAIPPDTALWAKAVILLGSFAMEIVWYGLAAVLLSSGPARLAYDRFGIWIERAIGSVLAAFGLSGISAYGTELRV